MNHVNTPTTVSNGRGLHLLLGRDEVLTTFAMEFCDIHVIIHGRFQLVNKKINADANLVAAISGFEISLNSTSPGLSLGVGVRNAPQS